MTDAAVAAAGDHSGGSVQKGSVWADEVATAVFERIHLGHRGAGSFGGDSRERREPQALG